MQELVIKIALQRAEMVYVRSQMSKCPKLEVTHNM